MAINKPRILFVGNSSWSMYNFRFNLFKFLQEKNFEIHIATPRDRCTENFQSNGMYYHELKRLCAKGTSPINEILLYKELYTLYKRLTPSMIFHYTIKPNIYGSAAARKLKIPSIAVATGLGYTFIRNNLVALIAQKLYKRFINRANEVWFLNGDDRNIFLKHKFVNRENTFVLPGEGIDTRKFCPDEAPGIGSRLKFLYSGRIISDKGIYEFVTASRLLKERGYKFDSLLLGFVDAENPAAISRKQIVCWENEGVVSYLGATDNIIPILRTADCFVLPSYREGIPKALLEAASLEKPIITTNCVGCKEVVDDHISGFLCKLKDATDLSKKMEQILLLSHEERVKMGKAGRVKVRKQFADEIVFEIYLNKILGILSKKNGLNKNA